MRARTLAETVEDHELLDPLLPADRLLYRLFHEEQVRAYPAVELETYCSCSRERVEELLTRFTSEDLKDMVVDGEVWVTCEFCNSRYRFDADASPRPTRRIAVSPMPEPLGELGEKRHAGLELRSATNSSAAWAWAMSPGPQITVGQPASSNSPASVP